MQLDQALSDRGSQPEGQRPEDRPLSRARRAGHEGVGSEGEVPRLPVLPPAQRDRIPAGGDTRTRLERRLQHIADRECHQYVARAERLDANARGAEGRPDGLRRDLEVGAGLSPPRTEQHFHMREGHLAASDRRHLRVTQPAATAHLCPVAQDGPAPGAPPDPSGHPTERDRRLPRPDEQAPAMRRARAAAHALQGQASHTAPASRQAWPAQEPLGRIRS